MKRWTARRVLTLFFGLVFALGTVLSQVQAGGMSIEMTMSSGPSGPGDGACAGCLDPGDESDLASIACPADCTLAGGFLVAAVAAEAPALAGADRRAGADCVIGRTFRPDPDPPRQSLHSLI
jgi:hypothetical protein